MSLEVLIEDSEIIQNLEQKAQEIPERLSELVTECAMIIQSNVMDEAPFITHNLQASTQIEFSDNGLTARIYPDEGLAPYAVYVIMGTAPHMIFPVEAQSLYWPGLGHPLPKGRGVYHPGTDANPYLERGFEYAKSDIDSEIENFKEWLIGE